MQSKKLPCCHCSDGTVIELFLDIAHLYAPKNENFMSGVKNLELWVYGMYSKFLPVFD